MITLFVSRVENILLHACSIRMLSIHSLLRSALAFQIRTRGSSPSSYIIMK